MNQSKTADPAWKNLYTAGGIAAFVQLGSILALAVVMAALGPKPGSVEEYFRLHQQSPLTGILRGDFMLLFLMGSYLFTFPALYFALRSISPVGALIATLMTLMAVIGFFVSESTFSLFYLGERYAQAVSEAQRSQLLAAGDAVVASDIWNSSSGYVGGILLQGAGLLISVIMLRSQDFSRVTAWSGLLANGFDLVQHVLHPFVPSISASISVFMGVFYIVWFPMLGIDLLKLGRGK
jgi:hypothetical protein